MKKKQETKRQDVPRKGEELRGLNATVVKRKVKTDNGFALVGGVVLEKPYKDREGNWQVATLILYGSEVATAAVMLEEPPGCSR